MIYRLPAVLLVLMSGCLVATGDEDPSAPGSDSFQDDDPPIGCQTGTGDCNPDSPSAPDDGSPGDAPGAPIGGSCDNTGQCVEGAVCGATFDAGEAGPLVCRTECIALDDASAWCSDDSACCSGFCSPRGLCLEPESADGNTTSGDTDGESDGADSTSGGTG